MFSRTMRVVSFVLVCGFVWMICEATFVAPYKPCTLCGGKMRQTTHTVGHADAKGVVTVVVQESLYRCESCDYSELGVP